MRASHRQCASVTDELPLPRACIVCLNALPGFKSSQHADTGYLRFSLIGWALKGETYIRTGVFLTWHGLQATPSLHRLLRIAQCVCGTCTHVSSRQELKHMPVTAPPCTGIPRRHWLHRAAATPWYGPSSYTAYTSLGHRCKLHSGLQTPDQGTYILICQCALLCVSGPHFPITFKCTCLVGEIVGCSFW